MVSHTKALHTALKPYPSMVEVAFLSTSANQKDQEYTFRRSMAKASTLRNAKPSLSQVVICSNISQYISPMKRREICSIQFCPGGVNSQLLLLFLPLNRITHETQNSRMVEVGSHPWTSYCPDPLLKQRPLWQIAQHQVQTHVGAGEVFP